MIDPQIDQECIVTSVGLVSPSTLQVVRNSLPGRLQVARTSLARRSQVARKSLATHTKSYQNQIKNPFKIVPKSIKFVSKSSEIISWAPKAPQRSATLAKIAPGTRQKLPQDLPRAPKSAPRVPQESPKSPPRLPKWAPRGLPRRTGELLGTILWPPNSKRSLLAGDMSRDSLKKRFRKLFCRCSLVRASAEPVKTMVLP